MQVLGQEGRRRRFGQDDDGRELLGRARHAVTVGPQHLTGLLGGIEHHARQDLGSHGMQPVLEAGHDAEVAATPLQGPEEVGVLVRACTHELPFGGHHFACDEVVAAQPVLAHEPAEAATDREPSDAGMGHDASGRGATVSLRCGVDLAPEQPWLRMDGAPLPVDLDALHGREVDYDAAA